MTTDDDRLDRAHTLFREFEELAGDRLPISRDAAIGLRSAIEGDSFDALEAAKVLYTALNTLESEIAVLRSEQ